MIDDQQVVIVKIPNPPLFYQFSGIRLGRRIPTFYTLYEFKDECYQRCDNTGVIATLDEVFAERLVRYVASHFSDIQPVYRKYLRESVGDMLYAGITTHLTPKQSPSECNKLLLKFFDREQMKGVSTAFALCFLHLAWFVFYDLVSDCAPPTQSSIFTSNRSDRVLDFACRTVSQYGIDTATSNLRAFLRQDLQKISSDVVEIVF